MQTPNAVETTVIRGIPVRKGPAREPCFRVVEENTALEARADPSVEPGKDMCDANLRNKLHTHMHNEMQSLEMAARTLADLPDTPWHVRMGLARQCWDESRHTRLLYRRLREIGGRKGEFPVMNYEWSVTCMMENISAHLAIQNRVFEGGEIDLLLHLIKMWHESGDTATAELLDGILADEIQHVRVVGEPFVPTEELKAWQIEWEKDHPVAPQDTKAKPLPPELQALIDRSVLPLKERQRLDKEARANEQAAQAARVAAQDRAEAEQFRAVISAVRRNGRNLEIDYEFTKGWEVLDGPNGHRLAFVVSQGGSKSVYTPTFGEVKKAGTLRLREQSVFTSDARVEVQIVLLDVFQKPKASVSNPASAK